MSFAPRLSQALTLIPLHSSLSPRTPSDTNMVTSKSPAQPGPRVGSLVHQLQGPQETRQSCFRKGKEWNRGGSCRWAASSLMPLICPCSTKGGGGLLQPPAWPNAILFLQSFFSPLIVISKTSTPSTTRNMPKLAAASVSSKTATAASPMSSPPLTRTR